MRCGFSVFLCCSQLCAATQISSLIFHHQWGRIQKSSTGLPDGWDEQTKKYVDAKHAFASLSQSQRISNSVFFFLIQTIFRLMNMELIWFGPFPCTISASRFDFVIKVEQQQKYARAESQEHWHFRFRLLLQLPSVLTEPIFFSELDLHFNCAK